MVFFLAFIYSINLEIKLLSLLLLLLFFLIISGLVFYANVNLIKINLKKREQ